MIEPTITKRSGDVPWPTPETDYEGNDLWAMRLAKPEPMTDFQRAMAMAAQQWVPGAQERMRMQQYNPHLPGFGNECLPFSGYFSNGPLGGLLGL